MAAVSLLLVCVGVKEEEQQPIHCGCGQIEILPYEGVCGKPVQPKLPCSYSFLM